jgi:hypothetical protein
MTTPPEKPLIDPRLVRALSHPLRVALLDLLTERIASPNQLKDIVGQPLGHAIELVDQRQRRGATEHFFRATPKSFLGSPDWRHVPGVFRRAVAGASLQAFIDKAMRALERGKLDTDGAAFTWMPVTVDERGKQELTGICQATGDELLAVQRNARRRMARAKTTGAPYLVGVMAFEAAPS